jgi:hypothetical protein
MPEEKQTDDIEKVLSDLKSIEPQGRPHRRSAPAEGRSEDLPPSGSVHSMPEVMSNRF